MSKVTSKLQLTLPKSLAEQYRIKPGDEVLWVASGDAIRLVPPGAAPGQRDAAERVKWFDSATARQRARERRRPRPESPPKTRGWKREDLYRRGGSD
ncbi:MAG TPA: AbrB/MazE/SpoVT family DNA-binding domain-containing protein [Polyangiaceae bacterium]|jgi:bifunctional DNA-binding transcriptional regulator/antitoxin component of YhaV-PrlF toxin-antitoxin module